MKGEQKVNGKKRRFDWKSVRRWSKYKYIQLLRAKGGPSRVARGFSIGLMVEMFTLPTGGLAFFLIFPLSYLLRANIPAALIGFVFGKIIYIPFAFLNKYVGKLVVPKHVKHNLVEHLPGWLSKLIGMNLDLIVGGMIVGAVLGLIAYFPIVYLLRYQSHRRKEKRKGRKAKLIVTDPS